jgi:preprotein translocase subunit SecD
MTFISVIMVGCGYGRVTSLVSSDIEREFEKKGGFQITYSPDSKNNSKLSSDQIEAIKKILSYRLQQKGLKDSFVTSDDVGNIKVKIIYNKSHDLEKIQTIMEIVSKKGYFSAQEINEGNKDTNGVYLQTGEIIFDGNKVSQVEVTDVTNGKADILIELDKETSQRFEEETEKLIGNKIGIFMDEELIFAPTIPEKISGGRFVIPGQLTTVDALDLAIIIRSGYLPVRLIQTSIEVVTEK